MFFTSQHRQSWLLLGLAVSAIYTASGCGSSQHSVTPSAGKKAAKPAVNALPELRTARLPHEQSRETAERPFREGDWFENVTAKSGVDFAYRDGNEQGFYLLLESVGGGCALFDYDRDGDVDLFITGGGQLSGPPIKVTGLPCALYRNDGNWSFTNVTKEVGLADDRLYTHGCTVGDFNNDGWPDVFVAGYRGCRLYRNDAGQTFTDVTTESGLKCDRWNVQGAWADFDRDGLLDLYVATYADWDAQRQPHCPNDKGVRDVCGPSQFPGAADYLFRNLGNGRFEDVSSKAGLTELERGMGVVATDLNGDGFLDFYVVNDAQENRLYINRGTLPWSEEGSLQGVAFSLTGEREGSMGVDAGDYNGDGLPDLWYTNFTNQDNSLLQNTGRDGFVSTSLTTGLVGVSRQWVGFGTGLVDFNNDGWLDLFVCNGHVTYESGEAPYFQPAQLFKNEQGKKYVDVTQQGGAYFSVPHAGRGAAVGDLDNDGLLDLVVVHQNDRVALLRNRLPPQPWLRLTLVGTKSPHDPVGAKVQAGYGERQLTNWYRGGAGYASYFDPRILVPRLDNSPTSITVTWPSGDSEVFADLQQGKTHEIVEGTGKPAVASNR